MFANNENDLKDVEMDVLEDMLEEVDSRGNGREAAVLNSLSLTMPTQRMNTETDSEEEATEEGGLALLAEASCRRRKRALVPDDSCEDKPSKLPSPRSGDSSPSPSPSPSQQPSLSLSLPRPPLTEEELIAHEEHVMETLSFHSSQYWANVCATQSDKAMELIYMNWDKVQDKLDWPALCANEHSPVLISLRWNEARDKIVWPIWCANPFAMGEIARRWDEVHDKVIWSIINANKSAHWLYDKLWNTEVVQANLNWPAVCANSSSIRLIANHWNESRAQFCRPELFTNECLHNLPEHCWNDLCALPEIVPWLDKRWNDVIAHPHIQNTVNWQVLSGNPAAISLFEKYWDSFVMNKIWWIEICANQNAIPLLEKHWHEIQDKICWPELCANSNAIPFIEQHLEEVKDKLLWDVLKMNPAASAFVAKYLSDRMGLLR